MVHPALLRTFALPGFAAGRSEARASRWGTLERIKRLLRRLNPRKPEGYRPELHYMRGGRTTGAKSLARRLNAAPARRGSCPGERQRLPERGPPRSGAPAS
jgi:hypothetical protein